MQWPTTVLVFPLFPTLLELIKKRAAPYPHAKTTSDIYSPFISSETPLSRTAIAFFISQKERERV
jgi:hypothetical protein